MNELKNKTFYSVDKVKLKLRTCTFSLVNKNKSWMKKKEKKKKKFPKKLNGKEKGHLNKHIDYYFFDMVYYILRDFYVNPSDNKVAQFFFLFS